MFFYFYLLTTSRTSLRRRWKRQRTIVGVIITQGEQKLNSNGCGKEPETHALLDDSQRALAGHYMVMVLDNDGPMPIGVRYFSCTNNHQKIVVLFEEIMLQSRMSSK